MPAFWWGTRKNVSPRMQIEFESMRAVFGTTFRLVVPHDERLLYWIGKVEINLATLRQREHELKIVYPENYPNRPAEAYVVQPHIYSEKHQYVDGQLCLFNPKDGEQYGWNPATSTAVTVASWAIQWLYAYYTWRATQVWPGIEEQVSNANAASPGNPRAARGTFGQDAMTEGSDNSWMQNDPSWRPFNGPAFEPPQE